MHLNITVNLNIKLCSLTLNNVSLQMEFSTAALLIPVSGDFPKVFIGDPTNISQGYKKLYILGVCRGIMGKNDTCQGPNLQLRRRKYSVVQVGDNEKPSLKSSHY